MTKMSKLLMEKLGCDGLNVLQNNGEISGQVINHYHMHLIPRYKDDGIVMKWVAESDSDGMVSEVLGKLGL